MANLAHSPDVVEAITGNVVDVVLHGQLAVQVDTEVPDDNVTLDYRPRLELIERAVVLVKLTREPNQMNSVFTGLS